jgi:competence ComEA-like helix-hairpin-helix protein
MTDADTDNEQPPTENAFILRVSDTRFLAVLSILVMTLLGLQIARSSGWGLRPVEIQRISGEDVEYRIDINRSRWVEWAQLPHIGETTARRIVADREINGPFASVDDVQRVPGIGPRTLAKLRPWLTNGEPDEPVSANETEVAGMDSTH